MANLTRSGENSKSVYHFHKVEKQEVETPKPHSALVMAWYKSDMMGESRSVDKTYRYERDCK